MQPGKGYSIISGQSGTSLSIDDPQLAGDPEQYRVTVMKTGYGYGVQCRKGFVRFVSMRATDPWAFGLWQAEVRKFYGYPTGSKTVGPFATSDESPLVDLGGYITIQPASVEGGSDNWGVYIIGCGDTMSGFWPYLAIMADGSDADTKSNFFNGSNPQIIVRLSNTLNNVEVLTPSGSEYLLIQGISSMVASNYNCQKWKIADLDFDGGTFIVTQAHLGPLCLQNPVNFQGLDTANLSPYTPAYEAEWLDWLGAWTDYTKDSSGATVQV
jgi:hypothetical protein